MTVKKVSNRQKCDYWLRRMTTEHLTPTDPRYAADGQTEFKWKEAKRMPELLVAGIDPGPKTHGLVVRGPAIRAFRAQVLFAGECDTDELLARLTAGLEQLAAAIIEWPRTVPRLKLKHEYMDATIGQAWILRDRLLALGVTVYCPPRQAIIAQLGISPFSTGRRDKQVTEELRKQGYEGECSSSHEEAALAAALLRYQHPANLRYKATT